MAADVRPASDRAPVSEGEAVARIRSLKTRLGSDVLLLAHHYQRDAVVAVADVVGDSLRLAQAAAAATARHIVFCGVRFMAETADILTDPGQAVYLPEANAGCSMADMASVDDLEAAWDDLAAAGAGTVLPVAYVNSTAALKAFVGLHGGLTCTSPMPSRPCPGSWGRAPRPFSFRTSIWDGSPPGIWACP